ncbi:RNA-binding protein pno1-like [Uloborus diversus]|uniref:RNA-binding protein pno1-like n=1 Tax=Uloborus diversus TaxID=327109 RepID=UPI00240A2A32|nr:RNA-binding protein pno1-like [Uloborus diversus]
MDCNNNQSTNEGAWSVPTTKKRKQQSSMEVDSAKADRPYFPPAKRALLAGSEEMRKIPVPQNRYGPLKENWMKIFTTVVQHLNLNIRFNLKTRMVEIRSCKETKDIASLQKATDFIQAFTLGFEVEDAMALVRLDELFLESFDIKDVKTLHGDHMSRAIGRIVGKGGKTKYTIENATKTRIVVADSKIHILGSYQNIRAARTTICNLILGSAPSKVYGTMRHLSSRLAESI